MTKERKNFYQNYFAGLMTELLKEPFFVKFLKTNREKYLAEFNKKNFYYNNEKIQVKNGCEKWVIISEKQNFVAKFPRCHYGYEQLEKEVYFYQKAKREKISKFFAASFKMEPMEIEGLVFYFTIMRKAEVIEKKYKEKMRENCKKNFRPFGGVGLVYDGEKIEDFMKLDTFLENNNINDIHNHNIGFRKDSFYLIDYSGYSGF